jgi:hypothetical protein
VRALGEKLDRQLSVGTSKEPHSKCGEILIQYGPVRNWRAIISAVAGPDRQSRGEV